MYFILKVHSADSQTLPYSVFFFFVRAKWEAILELLEFWKLFGILDGIAWILPHNGDLCVHLLSSVVIKSLKSTTAAGRQQRYIQIRSRPFCTLCHYYYAIWPVPQVPPLTPHGGNFERWDCYWTVRQTMPVPLQLPVRTVEWDLAVSA